MYLRSEQDVRKDQNEIDDENNVITSVLHN